MKVQTKSLSIAGVRAAQVAAYAVAFLMPLLLSGPQLVVGSLVNGLLFLAAGRFSWKENLPLLVLPSLGAVGHSTLFGTLTPFLVYMLPFIWVGNGLLVATYARFQDKSNSGQKTAGSRQLAGVIGAAAIKAVFLYSVAMVLIKFELAPVLFLRAMGLVQLVTALIGGGLALGVNQVLARDSA